MENIILVYGLFVLSSFIAIFMFIANAKRGWEDENGFHFGRRFKKIN